MKYIRSVICTIFHIKQCDCTKPAKKKNKKGF